MSMRADDGFLRTSWHWLVLGLGAAACAGAVAVWFCERGVDADEASSEAVAPYRDSAAGAATGVAAADLAAYHRAARDEKSPTPLVSVAPQAGSFLASEKRVHCAHCEGALVPDVKTCPFCGREQPEEAKKAVVLDADGDTLPDEWERKFGLNPQDPADAALDADGDLFTNLEEFAAKTDPKDRRDHPAYLDSLTIRLPLRQTFMPFHFTGVIRTPSGRKYQFKDPSRVKEYDRGNYSVLEGTEIGKTGFVATKYEELYAKRKMGGGMEKKVDVSVATVTRKADGKAVRLVIGARKTPIDIQAKLVFSRGTEPKEFTVVPGDSIDLNGEKYVIKTLKPLPKGAEITVESVANGKVRRLTALDE